MPFAFLAPVFLAGLAALVVPILIHLSSRPRKRVVEFPSLMFLEQVEYRDSRKRRLRNIVLFLLRSLALVLVAGAFARPFLDRSDAPAAAPEGGREVVVLLDRSGSMAAGDRMARARGAVGAVAGSLRRGDRATLVAFDHGAAAVNRATDQAAVLRAAADTVAASQMGTRFGPALRLAESILTASPLPRRELVLVSDFQRTGWDPDVATRMPAGTAIRMVAVGEAVANTFVADVRFGRERFSGRERVRVGATVVRREADRVGGGDGTGGQAGTTGTGGAGTESAADGQLPVELVLEGRVVGRRTLAVGSGGAETVEFDPVTLPDRPVRGTVRAGTDGVPGDNAFHFVLNAGRSLRVLLLDPRSAGDGAPGVAGAGTGTRTPAPYLARALEVGPRHDVTVVPVHRIGTVELAGFDVVVVNGADPGDASSLERFARAGGGVIIVLGPRSRAGTWAGTTLLPGPLRGTRDARGGAALTAIRSEHPVFEPFRSAAGLTGARFYRWRVLDPVDEATVLARFDGGDPAVAANPAGQGRVVVVASSLDGEWNDLVLQPGFVPMVHELVRFASGREPGPAWRTVGDLLELGEILAGVEPGAPALAPTGRGPGDRPVLLTPSDRPVPVDSGTLYTLRERGFYEVRDPRSDQGAVTVAVNGDPAESELAAVDPDVVEVAVSGGDAAPVTASFAPEDRERRQALWWYLLVGAFVLMAAETVLSNVLSRRPLPSTAGGGE